MKEGRILSTVGGIYSLYDGKDIFRCSPKGVFRKQKIKPLVGDKVIFDEEKLTIEQILPRKNEILRPRIANLDLAVVTVSLKKPDFSRELLNMFLSFLNLYKVNSIIVFTKTDLVDELPYDIKDYYTSIGYPSFFFSSKFFSTFSRTYLFFIQAVYSLLNFDSEIRNVFSMLGSPTKSNILLTP